VALGEGRLEFGFEESGQLRLREAWGLAFPLPQPGPTLGRRPVSVTLAVVNEGLPRRATLLVALAEVRHRPPAEGKTQFLAQGLKFLTLVEAQEELLLGQSSFDLTGGIAFHGVPP
jgi:hypothetical protein